MTAGRNEADLNGITQLGNQQTKYPQDYDPKVLETFPNKHPDNDYFVKFNCPEFTSLCPMTGQPDFATIYISYVPGEIMVRKQIVETLPFQFPQPRRLPRGLHEHHHEGSDCIDGAKIHRGVGQIHTERRHLDRSLLQLRQTRHKMGRRGLATIGAARSLS